MNTINIYEKQKNLNGITLINLIVTIIVIIILAGTSIYLLINNNILDRTTATIDLYKEKEAEKVLELKLLEINAKFPNINIGSGKLKIISDELCNDFYDEIDWVREGRNNVSSTAMINSETKLASLNSLKISSLPLLNTRIARIYFSKTKKI